MRRSKLDTEEMKDSNCHLNFRCFGNFVKCCYYKPISENGALCKYAIGNAYEFCSSAMAQVNRCIRHIEEATGNKIFFQSSLESKT